MRADYTIKATGPQKLVGYVQLKFGGDFGIGILKRRGPLSLVASISFGLMSITFTWYGVNYILATGLHSYRSH